MFTDTSNGLQKLIDAIVEEEDQLELRKKKQTQNFW